MKLIMKLIIILLFYNLSFISSYATEVSPSLVTDLSKKVISINVNFSGSKFHIFGAIKKNNPQISSIDQPPFDIIIEVIGPPITMNLFQKEKKFGFWIIMVHRHGAVPGLTQSPYFRLTDADPGALVAQGHGVGIVVLHVVLWVVQNVLWHIAPAPQVVVRAVRRCRSGV